MEPEAGLLSQLAAAAGSETQIDAGSPDHAGQVHWLVQQYHKQCFEEGEAVNSWVEQLLADVPTNFEGCARPKEDAVDGRHGAHLAVCSVVADSCLKLSTRTLCLPTPTTSKILLAC